MQNSLAAYRGETILRFDRAFGKRLIYVQIYYNFIVKFLISEFGLPPALNYVTDVFILLLMPCISSCWRDSIRKLHLGGVWKCVCCFTFAVVLSDVFNLVSPLLILWAVRNTYRFFAFYIACAAILEREDIEKIWSILLRFQALNIVLSIFQYFVLHDKQDSLGGIFGKGGNGASNIYFCILLIVCLSRYLRGKSSFLQLIYILTSTILLSALAEIKVYFFEVVIIAVLVILFSRFTLKMVFAIIVTVALAAVGLHVLLSIFPYWANQMNGAISNLQSFLTMAGATGGGYNISRTNVFSQISNLFFGNNAFWEIFGFGFGNCEMSTIPIFTSDFYKQYGYYNYRWFAHSMIFLETGYFGFITFCSFFIACFVHARKWKEKMENYEWVKAAVMALSILGIITLWYDNTLKTECAYIYYAVLAFSAVAIKQEKIQDATVSEKLSSSVKQNCYFKNAAKPSRKNHAMESKVLYKSKYIRKQML